jgi:hypothetical protein
MKARAQKDAADAFAAPLDACRTLFLEGKPFIGGTPLRSPTFAWR